MRKAYPSDITREQFRKIEADLAAGKKETRPRSYELYDIFCALIYVLKEGEMAVKEPRSCGSHNRTAYIDIPDEVFDIFEEHRKAEQAHQSRIRYHKAYYSLDRGDGIATQDEFDSKTILAQPMDETISTYKKFGLSSNLVGQIYFEGSLVREIYDPVIGTLITQSSGAAFPKGSIDIVATYSNGKLAGLRKTTQEEYDMRTQERIEAVQDYWIEQQTKK